MDAAKAERLLRGSDDMDTSETPDGSSLMDSDTPTQPLGKERQAGDSHLAFVADKGVVKDHAQW